MLPANYTFAAADNGVHTFAVTLYTAGTRDVTATDTQSGITGAAYVTVTAAALDHFQITAPTDATTGTAFDGTVTAVDAYGNTVTDYTGTITFSSTGPDPGIILPADYTFTAADNGVHTFAGGVTLVTLGQQTPTVQDTATGLQGSATVSVDPPGPGAGAPGGGSARRPRSGTAQAENLGWPTAGHTADWFRDEAFLAEHDDRLLRGFGDGDLAAAPLEALAHDGRPCS